LRAVDIDPIDCFAARDAIIVALVVKTVLEQRLDEGQIPSDH
jgi:hypothetical protein